jgi:YfiH family protein
MSKEWWIPVDLGAGVIAGFTTRFGGESAGEWDSLNLGAHVGDNPGDVLANRSLVGLALDLDGLAFSNQVHGNDVIHLRPTGERHHRDRQDAASDVPTGERRPREDDDVSAVTTVDSNQEALVVPSDDRGLSTTDGLRPHETAVADALEPVGTADAMVASVPGLGLGILVADCVPVILADAVSRVVAVVHAGRRGVESDVVGNAVRAMNPHQLARPSIKAAIGPSVCGRCYEVPQEMQDAVAAVVPEARSTTRDGTPGLDLPAAVRAQLLSAGVTDVVHVNRCTMEDDSFFSHRRATKQGYAPTGRQAGIAAIAAT